MKASGPGQTFFDAGTSFFVGSLVSSVGMPFPLSALGATSGLSGCSSGVMSKTRPDDDPMILVSGFEIGNSRVVSASEGLEENLINAISRLGHVIGMIVDIRISLDALAGYSLAFLVPTSSGFFVVGISEQLIEIGDIARDCGVRFCHLFHFFLERKVSLKSFRDFIQGFQKLGSFKNSCLIDLVKIEHCFLDKLVSLSPVIKILFIIFFNGSLEIRIGDISFFMLLPIVFCNPSI
ncbi:hypothetical protein Tco_1247117 [Tanacetum coccineum]